MLSYNCAWPKINRWYLTQIKITVTQELCKVCIAQIKVRPSFRQVRALPFGQSSCETACCRRLNVYVSDLRIKSFLRLALDWDCKTLVSQIYTVGPKHIYKRKTHQWYSVIAALFRGSKITVQPFPQTQNQSLIEPHRASKVLVLTKCCSMVGLKEYDQQLGFYMDSCAVSYYSILRSILDTWHQYLQKIYTAHVWDVT